MCLLHRINNIHSVICVSIVPFPFSLPPSLPLSSSSLILISKNILYVYKLKISYFKQINHKQLI